MCKTANNKEKTTKLPIIGIPGIDEQHREFMALLDELQGHLEKEKPACDFVIASFHKLTENLKVHIATEENLMEMIGFSGIADHKVQHKNLLKQISDAAETLEKSGNLNIADTIRFMREADLEHIAASDVEYAAHIENLMVLKQKYNISSVRAQVLTK